MQPDLFILAGPNGSGKTTVAEYLLDQGRLAQFFNADNIAKGLSRGSGSAGGINSGRIMLEELHRALDSGEGVAFETTLSGRTWINLIHKAKARGYRVSICYVGVQRVEVSIERVKNRVLEGGHDIPEGDLRRRFPRSLKLFFSTYLQLADVWYFFDNTGGSAVLIAGQNKPQDVLVYDTELFAHYSSVT